MRFERRDVVGPDRDRHEVRRQPGQLRQLLRDRLAQSGSRDAQVDHPHRPPGARSKVHGNQADIAAAGARRPDPLCSRVTDRDVEQVAGAGALLLPPVGVEVQGGGEAGRARCLAAEGQHPDQKHNGAKHDQAAQAEEEDQHELFGVMPAFTSASQGISVGIAR